MPDIVIKRCPVCPNIGKKAQEVVAALNDDMGTSARIEEGAKGEFSVLVDGIPVLQRNGDTLPTVFEVETAVNNAITVVPAV